MITLSKFAKLAHVSLSTASKAFSMSSEVNEQTREEIFKLAKELGCFKKFFNAKYPKYVIAIICPEFQSQYYSRIFSFLQEFLSERNCVLCAASTDFSFATEQSLLEYYNNYSDVDGIIIYNGECPIEDTYELPVVAINPKLSHPKIATIRTSSVLAMTETLEYFKTHNVDSIGYLGEKITKNRLALFKDQMLSAYGGYDEDLIAITEKRFEAGGYDAMETLFQRGKLPRALVCTYDYFAIGAIRCILDHGLSVPEDIAIVGHNNIPEAEYLDPPLSSVCPRHEVVCQTAADTILKLLNGKAVESEITINSKLHLRKSSEIE